MCFVSTPKVPPVPEPEPVKMPVSAEELSYAKDRTEKRRRVGYHGTIMSEGIEEEKQAGKKTLLGT